MPMASAANTKRQSVLSRDSASFMCQVAEHSDVGLNTCRRLGSSSMRIPRKPSLRRNAQLVQPADGDRLHAPLPRHSESCRRLCNSLVERCSRFPICLAANIAQPSQHGPVISFDVLQRSSCATRARCACTLHIPSFRLCRGGAFQHANSHSPTSSTKPVSSLNAAGVTPSVQEPHPKSPK